jgi:NAD(P)H-dependent flavin oxidoreductase YrpB (nitropropane dioxygenase family)
MIRTPLCDLFGIELPIMNAPMGLSASLELAAAVSNSGGLGLIAMAPRRPADIPTVLNQMRALTPKPFGINLVLPLDPPERLHEKLQVCLDWGVKIVTLFWGMPDEYVEQAHQAGALVTYTVGSVSEARDAAQAGVDVIVAQGWEAGGHVRGTITTLALVPPVVDAVSPTPVVAAGGIADGRGVAAALALGGSGVWIGTRFLASTEALAHPSYKQRVLEANAEDTVYSSLFDGGWPDARHRSLRNSTIEMWEQAGRPPSGQRPLEGEIIAHLADGTPIRRYSSLHLIASMQGEIEAMALYAGQGVGLVKDIKPAAMIVEQLKCEAEQVFEKWKLST